MSTLSDPLSTQQSEGPDHRQLLITALRIRAFEEKLLDLFGSGHIRGTVHTCLGQELLAVTISHFISSNDWVFGTHRGHGYYLSLTGDYEGLAREILGRKNGASLGIGGSQHLHSGQILTNGIQGGLVPIAVGASTDSTDGIAVSIVGDGTLGQGVLYESLNFASLQSSSTLMVVEDNEIAQTTPQVQNVAGSIRKRFEAFGWKFFAANDEDLGSLVNTVAEAFAFVRTQRSPAVVHVKTRRLGPHSKGDDNRPRENLSSLWANDFLTRTLADSLECSVLNDEIRTEIGAFLEGLLAEPAASDVPRFDHAHRTLICAPLLHNSDRQTGLRIRQQITQALDEFLRVNQTAWFIGEDIEHLPTGMESPYRGAFGVSDDLSVRYPGRVRNFPISEQGITGFALGRALAGKPTVAEIMFGDFATLTIDQLRQQASKLVGVYREPVSLPFVLRTPMGGRRGYGPTHSQNYEGLFFGIPNTVVYAVSPFGVKKSLVADLAALGLPVIMIENKDLYALYPRQEVSSLYEIVRPESALQPVSIRPSGRRSDLTLVSYGHAAELGVRILDSLARRSEIFVDLLIYEVLSPMDASPIADSLALTHRLAIVEEGIPEMGLASTILASLHKANRHPQFAVATIGAQGDIGASETSETAALINEERLVRELTRLVAGGTS